MDWIKDNYAEVLAFLFALYAAARAWVILTPTKSDDEWLEKNIGKPLGFIAKAFGLDLKQGRKAK